MTTPEAFMLTHPELPNVQIRLVEVTPAMAAEYLTRNAPNQRRADEDTINKYAADMDEWFWKFNGAPILFDKNDHLIDGQHRLKAIVASGREQYLMVITGLDSDTIAVVDAGRKRSYADFLWMEKQLAYPSFTSALVRAEWYWQQGNYGDRGVARVSVPEHLYAYPTTPQLENVRLGALERSGVEMAAAVRFGVSARRKFSAITITAWGLAYLRLSEFDPYLREQFFNEVLDEPLNGEMEYPINCLRNRLGREPDGSLDRAQQLHFLFRTFNAWVASKPLSTLRLATPVRWDTLEMPPVKES